MTPDRVADWMRSNDLSSTPLAVMLCFAAGNSPQDIKAYHALSQHFLDRRIDAGLGSWRNNSEFRRDYDRGVAWIQDERSLSIPQHP